MIERNDMQGQTTDSGRVAWSPPYAADPLIARRQRWYVIEQAARLAALGTPQRERWLRAVADADAWAAVKAAGVEAETINLIGGDGWIEAAVAAYDNPRPATAGEIGGGPVVDRPADLAPILMRLAQAAEALRDFHAGEGYLGAATALGRGHEALRLITGAAHALHAEADVLAAEVAREPMPAAVVGRARPVAAALADAAVAAVTGEVPTAGRDTDHEAAVEPRGALVRPYAADRPAPRPNAAGGAQ